MIDPIEKIRRLLRLGQSPNEHEARSAMAFAAKLAAKHAIDLDQIKDQQERERITHERFASSAAVDRIERVLASLVQAVMPVHVIIHKSLVGKDHGLTFVGTPSAIAQARSAYAYLLEQAGLGIERWRKERRLKNSRPTRAGEVSWVEGFSHGVGVQALKAQRELVLEDARNAIVLADLTRQRNEYTKDLGAKNARDERPIAEDAQAHGAGFVTGYSTKLPNPSEATPVRKTLT